MVIKPSACLVFDSQVTLGLGQEIPDASAFDQRGERDDTREKQEGKDFMKEHRVHPLIRTLCLAGCRQGGNDRASTWSQAYKK